VLHTDIDQFSDMQFVQLTGELLQGKHGAPCIAVGIRQRTVSCFECLNGPVQPFQFVDCCLELGVRHSSPFAVCVVLRILKSARCLQQAEQADHGVDGGLDHGPSEERGA